MGTLYFVACARAHLFRILHPRTALVPLLFPGRTDEYRAVRVFKEFGHGDQ